MKPGPGSWSAGTVRGEDGARGRRPRPGGAVRRCRAAYSSTLDRGTGASRPQRNRDILAKPPSGVKTHLHHFPASGRGAAAGQQTRPLLVHRATHAQRCSRLWRHRPVPWLCPGRLAPGAATAKPASRAGAAGRVLRGPAPVGLPQPAVAAAPAAGASPQRLLKPLARAFDAAITAARPSRGDDVARLRAKADSLSEVVRQLRMLDEAAPVWPLRTKRLGPVVATAVLPVVIPLLTTVLSNVLSKLLTG